MTDRSRQLKNAARDKRKSLLSNLSKIRSGEVSRSATLELREEGDVFDMVDEDDYRKLVEDRRKNTDFVVDDGVYTCIHTSFLNICDGVSCVFCRKFGIL